MRNTQKLNQKTLQDLPSGKHGDGNGLWLYKRADGGSQWVVRVTVHGRRREMGLGSPPLVSLSEARDLAHNAKKLAKQGVDPIRDREKRKRQAGNSSHLFKDVAQDAFAAKKAELKEEGEAGGWFSPLENHVIPKIGHIPIEDIDQHDIRRCLAPIWNEKPSTAKKAMDRIGITFRHAAALDLDVDIQATEKARILLGAQEHNEENIEAMNRDKLPRFYTKLQENKTKYLALRFLILTGVRTKPLRHMTEDQIDGNVWIIPADLMKGKKGKTEEFRVPLSREAMKVLNKAKEHSRNGYIFPSNRGGPMRAGALSDLMDDLGETARPHGFRSTLRDWLDDVERAEYAVAETCLAHKVGSKTERAYRRTDYLDQRRIHMNNWADFVTKRIQE